MRETRDARYLVACQVLGLQPTLVLFVTPFYFGALARQMNFSDTQLATVGAVEATSAAFVVACLAAVIRRINIRLLGTVAVVVQTAAIIACIVVGSLGALLPLRALVGAGGALVLAVGNLHIAATRMPERWFGWQTTITTLLVMGGVFGMPRIDARFGLAGFYVVLVVLTPATLWAIRSLPTQAILVDAADESSGGGPAGGLINRASLAALAAVILYAGYIYPTYNFSERIGTLIGLTPVYVGTVLSVTTPIGLVGSLLATVLADRFGSVRPLALCAALTAVGGGALIAYPNALGYWVALGAMSFVWNYVQPYLYANVGRADPTGRGVFLIGSAQHGARAGMSIVTGLVLARQGVEGVAALGILLMAAAFACTWVAARLIRSRRLCTPAADSA